VLDANNKKTFLANGFILAEKSFGMNSKEGKINAKNKIAPIYKELKALTTFLYPVKYHTMKGTYALTATEMSEIKFRMAVTTSFLCRSTLYCILEARKIPRLCPPSWLPFGKINSICWLKQSVIPLGSFHRFISRFLMCSRPRRRFYLFVGGSRHKETRLLSFGLCVLESYLEWLIPHLSAEKTMT